MVADNEPFSTYFPKNKGVMSSNISFLWARKVPFADNKIGVFVQRIQP